MSGAVIENASLNLATLKSASFDRKLHAALSAGFPAVGLIHEEMQRLGAEGLKELRLSELLVSDIVGVSGWMSGDRSSRSVAIFQAERAFELAAEVRCDLVVAEPEAGPVDPIAGAVDFHGLCRLAEPYGVRVGLEFNGGFQQVKDVAAAWEIVQGAEAENGGLVVDAFHFHWGGSTVDMLEGVPGKSIFLVQVSDCMERPRYEVEDGDRVYPGEGAIALEPLVAAMKGKGYAGYYSLEVLNEDYWQEDPMIVARDAMRAVRRLQVG